MLWRERVSSYWNEAIRYLRLIFNSGFLFTIYVLIIIGSYYYSQMLDWLPETFPAVWVFTIVFTWLLTRSRVRTFVKHADLVFLLPYEAKLTSYFRASLLYSFLLQVSVLSVVMIVLGPLFFLRIGEDFWFTLALLFIVKAWNVITSWNEQRLPSEEERRGHLLLRGMVNGVFCYLLFTGAGFGYVAALFGIMAGLLFLYYRPLARRRSLKWEHLINVEQQMVMFFYRIANAFTDVPQLKRQIRERRYLNGLLPILGDKQQSIFHYLFARSFLRSNDYFGIYLRLVFVCALLLYVLPTGWLQLIVLILFMHMVMMQLSTLWYHYDVMMWVDLYPIDSLSKKGALTFLSLRLLLLMLGVQVIVLLFVSSLQIAGISIVLGGVFGYFGSTTLIHRRKKV